ncbi:MAG: hypothetical protein JRI36_13820 [Deltaproteobacteria bacterium]|nr:hypothetical protein [Deltaproteobacteria bacterium]
MGRVAREDRYEALIVNAAEEHLMDILYGATDIPEGASWGVVTLYETVEADAPSLDLTSDFFRFLEQLALQMYRQTREMPTTRDTSGRVWQVVAQNGEFVRYQITCPGLSQAKDPFTTAILKAPGNLTRWLLQKAEFQLVRFLEKLHYPNQYIEKLQERWQRPFPSGWPGLAEVFGEGLEDIIAVSKSLTQSRRARAGNSFQWYLSYLLDGHHIPYDEQAGGQRVDFLLFPRTSPVVLSAKTTARERWKQLEEGAYFITLDRGITQSKLAEILSRSISIVVPEVDKKHITHYRNEASVVTFKDFFAQMSGRVA